MNISESLGVMKLVIRKYGFLGFLKMIWTDVLYDYRKGVDTYSPVAKDDLFDGDRLKLQNRYVPSTFSIIEYGINESKKYLGDDLSEVNFIDYGSGKGKVPIAATQYGFNKCIGIEYSPELHDIAVKNITKLGLTDKIELIHGDATEFVPSENDRLLYFFNPFMGKILEACLENIVSVKPDGERVIIVYNPVEDEVFSRFFKKQSQGVVKKGNVRYALYLG